MAAILFLDYSRREQKNVQYWDGVLFEEFDIQAPAVLSLKPLPKIAKAENFYFVHHSKTERHRPSKFRTCSEFEPPLYFK